MIPRFLIIISFVAIFACPVSFAADDGTYQRTKDGKTLVWNNDPKPQDAAKWSGGRDEDGYATGYGGLTWYKVEETFETGSNLPTHKNAFVSHYSGNMVKGKFEGPVVGTDTRGRKYHASFVDGARKGKWVARNVPLPESRSGAGVHRKQSSEQVENISRPTPKLENVEPVESAKPEPPAEGPSPMAHQASKPQPPPKPAEKPDDSVRSLAMPPSSLRTSAEPSVAPEPSSSPNSAESPASSLAGPSASPGSPAP